MNNPVETARKRLAEIEQEAEKLRLFLASWESVADILGNAGPVAATELNPVDKQDSAEPKARTRAVNPPTETVVDTALFLLKARGHPMSRRELHQALWNRGVEVRGTDPVKTLGTILWRAKDKLIQLEGYGYWPKEMSYGRANYLRPQERPPAPSMFDD